MTITEPATHYPTLVPVPIADLEAALGLLEVLPDYTELADAGAVARLRTTLTHALEAQRRARADHPSLDIDEPAHDAANVLALPVAMHRGGHVTEAHAARSVELKAGGRRATVLAELAKVLGGLTDNELEDRLAWEPGDGAKRRTELLSIRLVTQLTEPGVGTVTRPSRRGRPSIVWTITDRGLAALDGLGYRVLTINTPAGPAGRIVELVTPVTAEATAGL